MCTHAHTRMHTCMRVDGKNMHTYAYTTMYINTCTCTQTCMHVQTCACTHMHARACTHAHTHTHMHALTVELNHH